MSGSLAKKHIQIARQSRKRRSDGLTFLVELYMMTQDRRSEFVVTAVMVVVAAGWLWSLVAFADWIFRQH